MTFSTPKFRTRRVRRIVTTYFDAPFFSIKINQQTWCEKTLACTEVLGFATSLRSLLRTERVPKCPNLEWCSKTSICNLLKPECRDKRAQRFLLTRLTKKSHPHRELGHFTNRERSVFSQSSNYRYDIGFRAFCIHTIWREVFPHLCLCRTGQIWF